MIWLNLSIAMLLLSLVARIFFLKRAKPTHESEHKMSEDNKPELPPTGLADILSALQDSTDEKIGGVIDLNRDIVLATRKMAHNILKLRQAHIEEAERLHAIAADLIDSAIVSSTIAADLIDVEFGGDLFDPSKFLSQGDDEDEEDEE